MGRGERPPRTKDSHPTPPNLEIAVCTECLLVGGMEIKTGQCLGETQVIGGVIRGNADSQTGELLNIDDDRNERAVHLVTSTSHKFEKLLWLPLTHIEVAVFFNGIGGFDMGVRSAQDRYGVSFKIVLGIDNSTQANEVYSRTFPEVMVVCHTRLVRSST